MADPHLPAVPAKFHLRMRLLDFHGKPLPRGTVCGIEWADKERQIEVTLDDDGVLDANVPLGKKTWPTFWLLHIRQGPLLFTAGDFTIYLERASFGPADQVKGARARLNNLGYLAESHTSSLDAPMDDRTRRALERFQTANHILDTSVPNTHNRLGVPSGDPRDPRTQARLAEAHDTAQGALVK